MKNAKRPSEPALTGVPKAAQEYVKAGLKVIQWAGDKSKGPREEGWNRPESAISDPKQALSNSQGIGLAHLYSRTMALDIDNLDLARAYFQKVGIDLLALLKTGVRISSGRPGRAKLIYYIPQDLNAADFLTINDQDNGFELRCASQNGTTVQDVLPPTIHPDTGKPYVWAGPDDQPEPWRHIPLAPMALLEHWYSRLNERKSRSAAGPVDLALVPVLQSALTAIDPDCDYATWLAVGMALDAAGQGDLWDEWSQGGSKYQPGDCEARLLGFKPDGGVGVGTLFHHARQAGWDAAAALDGAIEELEALDVSECSYTQCVTRLAAVSAFCRPMEGVLDPVIRRLARKHDVKVGNFTKALTAANSEQRGSKNMARDAALMLLEQRQIQFSGNRFGIYTGTHWRFMPDAEAGQLLDEILTENGWDNSARTTSDAVKTLTRLAPKESFLSTEPQPVINCLNGELWFESDGTRKLKPHSPGSGLTWVLDVEYDATAQAEVFQEALVQMFLPPRDSDDWTTKGPPALRLEAEDMARHMEEIIAYVIVPDRWLACWFFFFGKASNGKTTVSRVMQMLLPADAVASVRLGSIEKDTFGAARLVGKALLIDDDIDANTVLPDGFLKKYSEGKPMTARRMQSDTDTSFYNHTVPVLLGNIYPRTADVTGGARRRAQFINFPRRFYKEAELVGLDEKLKADKDDPQLFDKLKAERAGIINVLAAAYQRLRERKDWQKPAQVEAATRVGFRMGHSLVDFIDAWCVTTQPENPDADSQYKRLGVKCSDFNQAFRHWLELECSTYRLSKADIRRKMESLDYKTKKDSDGVVRYVGLWRRPADEGDDEGRPWSACPPM